MPTSYTFTVRAVDSTAPTPQTVDKTFTLTVDFRAVLATGSLSSLGRLTRLLAPAYQPSDIGPMVTTNWSGVDAIAVSKDGTRLAAVCGATKWLFVFNPITADLIYSGQLPDIVFSTVIPDFGTQPTSVADISVAFNPSGSRMAVSYSNDSSYGQIVEFETSTWSVAQALYSLASSTYYRRVTYSPSGSQLSVWRYSINFPAVEVNLLVLDSSDITLPPVTLSASFNPAVLGEPHSWSPDGSLLAVKDGNTRVRVFETASWSPVSIGLGVFESVSDVAFSPDANYLLIATGSEAYSFTVDTTFTLDSPVVRNPSGSLRAVWLPDATGFVLSSTTAPYISFWDRATASRTNQSVSLRSIPTGIAISDAI